MEQESYHIVLHTDNMSHIKKPQDKLLSMPNKAETKDGIYSCILAQQIRQPDNQDRTHGRSYDNMDMRESFFNLCQ